MGGRGWGVGVGGFCLRSRGTSDIRDSFHITFIRFMAQLPLKVSLLHSSWPVVLAVQAPTV